MPRFLPRKPRSVYNSDGMEDLAPEDLVDEWSDLSASSLGSGARLGRYELLIPIAYGGMARVWAARLHGQRGFSKTVAIKTILPHLAHNPEFERMFLDEARIAAGVHNPNVCEIYELGEEGNVLYLVMEWVNGDSLMHVLRGATGKTGTPIDVRLAARIVADACAGLHAAHELCDDDGRLLNVVHRDVSPHNILVSLEGNVKVADFGVAKALGQTHQETAAGQVKGKVAYMAPEQIGGNAFDRRADIFGMGCVLYEAATGVQPFRGGGDPQIMQAVLRGTYEPPSTLVKGFPAELAAVIDCALAPEPRGRFATAEMMRVAIEEWLAKSGSIVTSTQVGALVRQRLGASLDKRREHVKAAMAALQPDAPTTRPLGHTPSQPQPGQSRTGQSHSGVVSTGAGQPAVPSPPPMRARTPSMPQAPSPPPALPPPLPARARLRGGRRPFWRPLRHRGGGGGRVRARGGRHLRCGLAVDARADGRCCRDTRGDPTRVGCHRDCPSRQGATRPDHDSGRRRDPGTHHLRGRAGSCTVQLGICGACHDRRERSAHREACMAGWCGGSGGPRTPDGHRCIAASSGESLLRYARRR